MISVAVFNDQDLPVASKRPGEQDAAVKGCDHLSAFPGFKGEPFAGDTKLIGLAEPAEHRAARGNDKGALRLGEGAHDCRLARVDRRRRHLVRLGAWRAVREALRLNAARFLLAVPLRLGFALLALALEPLDELLQVGSLRC